MNNLVEKVDSFWWPKTGKSCRDYTIERKNVPQIIAGFCQKRGVILHAGGNVGYYAKQYAALFERVYVWEPEAVNFYCLNLNVTEQNVYKFQGILGDTIGQFGLAMSADSGGHNMTRNPFSGPYIMTKIDNLGLEGCDLIHLDVEGYENEVLSGAINTIKKFHPIIAAEVNWSDCSGFLEGLGYIKVGETGGDWIFKYGQ